MRKTKKSKKQTVASILGGIGLSLLVIFLSSFAVLLEALTWPF